MKVKALMHARVITVNTATPLVEVARLLVENRISGVPVLDDHGEVVGVLSEADFVARELHPSDGAGRPTRHRVRGGHGHDQGKRQVSATTAGQAMTTPAIVVSPETTVRQAARSFVEHRINRLPVVDRGQLVGIFTRSDLVRVFAESDIELEHRVREEVLGRALWMDPTALDVSVERGVVTVSGTVDRLSTATALTTLVGRLDGILDVRMDITWLDDDSHVSPSATDILGPTNEP